MQYDHIRFLSPGETPWNNEDPGEMPGPWSRERGKLAKELASGGIVFLDLWEAGDQLWAYTCIPGESAWRVGGVLTWGLTLDEGLSRLGLDRGDVPVGEIEPFEPDLD